MHLKALAATLGHDAGHVRERARDLLSRPPYRAEPDGLLAQVRDRVQELLARLLDAVAAAFGQGTGVAWAVVLIGTVLLLAAAWYATRGFAVDRRIPAPTTPAPRRTSTDWAAEGERHAALGAWREAVRCRYAAIVTGLVEAGVVPDVPGRTARELVEEVGEAAPALTTPLRRAATTFDAVWYGRAAATAHDAEALAGALREVQRHVGSGRRQAVGA